jgi:hypothetical protein
MTTTNRTQHDDRLAALLSALPRADSPAGFSSQVMQRIAQQRARAARTQRVRVVAALGLVAICAVAAFLAVPEVAALAGSVGGPTVGFLSLALARAALIGKAVAALLTSAAVWGHLFMVFAHTLLQRAAVTCALLYLGGIGFIAMTYAFWRLQRRTGSHFVVHPAVRR